MLLQDLQNRRPNPHTNPQASYALLANRIPRLYISWERLFLPENWSGIIKDVKRVHAMLCDVKRC